MIRISGGTFRGKVIKTTRGLKTRPTNAKVRAALFNIIRDQVINSTWLDLFAGSGAIGLEALSREARSVTFVEKDYNAFRNLKHNIEHMQCQDKSLLIKKDALSFLSGCDTSFDFIYLDPPYQSSLYEQVFQILAQKKNIFYKHSSLIVEHMPQKILPDLTCFKLEKSYKYGDTSLTFFNYA